VFNINNLSRGLTKLNTFYAKILVAQMEKEREEEDELGNKKNTWHSRAERFKKAESMYRDEHIMPSKWRLVQYAMSRPKAAFLVVSIAFSRESSQPPASKKGQDIPQTTRSEKDTKSARWLRRWRFWEVKKSCVV
jgi:hypothetical protein